MIVHQEIKEILYKRLHCRGPPRGSGRGGHVHLFQGKKGHLWDCFELERDIPPFYRELWQALR